MQIIGIVGAAGSGKSTVARRLVERFGYQPGKFAKALKLMLRTLLIYRGCPEAEIDRMIEGDLKELPSKYLNGRSPRHSMQTLGTEWGRDCIGADLWVGVEGDHLSLGALAATGAGIVFDDVRFANEVAMIRRHGGEIWGVGPLVGEAGHEAGHVSETLVVTPDLRFPSRNSVAERLADVDLAAVGLSCRGS